jgi:predicted Rossmann-fold nucleotide-binding protein
MISNQVKKIITVIGGTSKFGLTGDRDEAICQRIGVMLAEQEEDYIIQTGGTGGYPAYLSEAYGKHKLSLKKSIDGLITHYVPIGSEKLTQGLLGDTVITGRDMAERRINLLKLKADVVLAISGGPGTADEINLAHANNRKIICFVGSGGASAGQFADVKKKSPVIPDFCKKNKIISNQDPRADIDEIAQELFRLLHE